MKRVLNHKIFLLLIASFAVGAIYPDNVIAAEKQDKSARRAAQMIQKLKQDMEQEKASMQAQFDMQKKELEDKLKSADDQLQKLTANLSVARRKVSNLENDIIKLNAEKVVLVTKQQETQAQLESTQKNLADLKSQYQQAQADIKFNDNQRKTLSANLSLTNKSLSSCQEKNTKLYQYGSDLIKIYDQPSTYNAVMRKESFFQLKRVELENILQDQKDKLDDEHLITGKSVYQ